MNSGSLVQIWRKHAHGGAMQPVSQALLVEARGMLGNADWNGPRQVTLLSKERWEEVMTLAGKVLDPAQRRANLLFQGVVLRGQAGQVLQVGPARIRIQGETHPCELMDRVHPGLRRLLQEDGRGGVFGEVLRGGEIKLGDRVSFENT